MIDIKSEPHIKVGLMTGAKTARVSLSGGFIRNGGERVPDGDYAATFDDGAVRLEGPAAVASRHRFRFRQSILITAGSSSMTSL